MSSPEVWPRRFPYQVDYNDHFETPEIAYRDIIPLLDFVSGKSRETHCIYDPYFCNGRSKLILGKLGFPNVVHECRDFYRDIKNQSVPQYDTFVSNPPYSDQHKEKCLEFVVEQLHSKGRPFFVLMPNYVASREYYRRLIEKENHAEDVVYLLPSERYDYDHPEGTGKSESPFSSIWYCGIGHSKVVDITRCNVGNATLVTNLQKLRDCNAIPTLKRPNPKQRRKRKAYNLKVGSADASHDSSPSSTVTTATVSASPNHKGKSRYRDESGRRTKRRF